MSRNHEAWRCRDKLKTSIAELEKKGFLASLPVEERFVKQAKGSYHVCFTVGNKRPGAVVARIGKKPGDTSENIKAELMARGIHPDSAKQFTETLTAERIRSLIEYTDAQAKRNPQKVTDRTRFLAAALHRGYEIPKDFETEARRREKAQAHQARERRQREREEAARSEEARRHAERRRQVDEYLATLPNAERENVVQTAISQAPQFVRQLYYRRVASDGASKLASEVLRSMVDKFVLTLLSGDRDEPGKV